METLAVSIIIPTFNPNKYLYECINSLENQTFNKENFEIIIVLNGPKNPYYEIILNYLEVSSFVNKKLIYTNTIGVSNARNIGIINSKGKNICFIDDDDLVSLNYIEGLYKQCDDNAMVISNLKCFNNNINSLHDDYITIAFKKFKDKKKLTILEMRKFLSSSCGKLVPKGMINNARFNTKLTVMEDACFMFKISKDIKQTYLADETVIYYRRIRNASVSRKQKSVLKIIQETILFIKCLIANLLNNQFFRYNYILLFMQISASIKYMLKKIIR